MTNKKESADSDEVDSVDTDKNVSKKKNVAEKLEAAGVMRSAKTSPASESKAEGAKVAMSTSNDNAEENSTATKEAVDETVKHDPGVGATGVHVPAQKTRWVSPMLITILLAIPAAGAMVYYFMPDQVSSILSLNKDTTSNGADQSQQNYMNAPPFTSQNTGRQNWQQTQPPEWAIQQRADMEKRRLEYEKNNNENYRPDWTQQTSMEKPQWVIDRQAELAQQRQKYQQELEQQQKKMAEQQQELANQQEAWLRNSSNMPYNHMAERPNHMKHPVMRQNNDNYYSNNSQMRARGNNTNPYAQNPQQYYQSYNYPPQAYYYNRPPFQGYGPYYAPYGWGGPVYR